MDLCVHPSWHSKGTMKVGGFGFAGRRVACNHGPRRVWWRFGMDTKFPRCVPSIIISSAIFWRDVQRSKGRRKRKDGRGQTSLDLKTLSVSRSILAGTTWKLDYGPLGAVPAHNMHPTANFQIFRLPPLYLSCKNSFPFQKFRSLGVRWTVWRKSRSCPSLTPSSNPQLNVGESSPSQRHHGHSVPQTQWNHSNPSFQSREQPPPNPPSLFSLRVGVDDKSIEPAYVARPTCPALRCVQQHPLYDSTASDQATGTRFEHPFHHLLESDLCQIANMAAGRTAFKWMSRCLSLPVSNKPPPRPGQFPHPPLRRYPTLPILPPDNKR